VIRAWLAIYIDGAVYIVVIADDDNALFLRKGRRHR